MLLFLILFLAFLPNILNYPHGRLQNLRAKKTHRYDVSVNPRYFVRIRSPCCRDSRDIIIKVPKLGILHALYSVVDLHCPLDFSHIIFLLQPEFLSALQSRAENSAATLNSYK